MDNYLLWNIETKKYESFDNATDNSVKRVIRTYSKIMAKCYEKNYLTSRGKRKFIAVPLSMSDNERENFIKDILCASSSGG